MKKLLLVTVAALALLTPQRPIARHDSANPIGGTNAVSILKNEPARESSDHPLPPSAARRPSA